MYIYIYVYLWMWDKPLRIGDICDICGSKSLRPPAKARDRQAKSEVFDLRSSWRSGGRFDVWYVTETRGTLT